MRLTTPLYSGGLYSERSIVNGAQVIRGNYGWLTTSSLYWQQVYGIVGTPGKMRNLRVYFEQAPGAGLYRTLVLMKNDVATALSVTISGFDTEGTSSQEVSLGSYDYLYWKESNNSGPPLSSGMIWIIADFVADGPFVIWPWAGTVAGTSGWSHIFCGATITVYANPIAAPCPLSCWLKKWSIRLDKPPGVGNAWNFFLYVNGVATPVQFSISGSQTTGQWTGSHKLNPWDKLSIYFTRSNSAAGASFVSSLVIQPQTLGQWPVWGSGNFWSSYDIYNPITGFAQEMWTEIPASLRVNEATYTNFMFLAIHTQVAGKGYDISVRHNGGTVDTVRELGPQEEIDLTHITVEAAEGDQLNYLASPYNSPLGAHHSWGMMGEVPYIPAAESHPSHYEVRLPATLLEEMFGGRVPTPIIPAVPLPPAPPPPPTAPPAEVPTPPTPALPPPPRFPPRFLSISPARAYQGQTLTATIRGVNFQPGATQVTFEDNLQPKITRVTPLTSNVQVQSSTLLTVTIGPLIDWEPSSGLARFPISVIAPGPKNMVVQTPGGQAVLRDAFTIEEPIDLIIPVKWTDMVDYQGHNGFKMIGYENTQKVPIIARRCAPAMEAAATGQMLYRLIQCVGSTYPLEAAVEEAKGSLQMRYGSQALIIDCMAGYLRQV